jgi:hypothetical protein
MEPLPYALTGYLDRLPVPGTGIGTAAWRLTSSPDGCTEEQEAVIPCVTSNPDLAHTLLAECQPGDLLRVTGHLTLPDTADGHIRLDADTLEVLPETGLELEELPQEEGEDGDVPESEEHDERARAVQALTEALAGLSRGPTPGGRPEIRLIIGPIGNSNLDLAHCHSFDVTTAITHKLADAVDAMHCWISSQPPSGLGDLDSQALADLTDFFDDLDLTEITQAVLDAALPENRVAVTRALDDMFGDIPVPGTGDSDQ